MNSSISSWNPLYGQASPSIGSWSPMYGRGKSLDQFLRHFVRTGMSYECIADMLQNQSGGYPLLKSVRGFAIQNGITYKVGRGFPKMCNDEWLLV